MLVLTLLLHTYKFHGETPQWQVCDNPFSDVTTRLPHSYPSATGHRCWIYSLWIGVNTFLKVMAPFLALCEKRFFVGRTQHDTIDMTPLTPDTQKQMKTLIWALINIKLSYSQPRRAIQWVVITSFVLQLSYEVHVNVHFYHWHSDMILTYDTTLWAIMRRINYIHFCIKLLCLLLSPDFGTCAIWAVLCPNHHIKH